MKNNGYFLLIILIMAALSGCKKTASVMHIEPVIETMGQFRNPLSDKGKRAIPFTENGTDYLFIVYADCSDCISTFFYALNEIADENPDRIFVLVPEGSAKVLSYYLNNSSSTVRDNISILESIDLLDQPVSSYNGHFYKVEDKAITKCWRVSHKES